MENTGENTHVGKRIDRIPITIPVVHDDRLGHHARNTEFLRDVVSQRLKAWCTVACRDMQMLLRAGDLYKHVN